MPRKPKKPCGYPGCPNLTEGRYCKEHEKQMNQSYEKYGRDKAARRRYGRAWKRIRDSYVKEHPFCEICFEKGILVPVDEVHHKLPLSEVEHMRGLTSLLYVSHVMQRFMASVVIIMKVKNIVFTDMMTDPRGGLISNTGTTVERRGVLCVKNAKSKG